MSEILTEMQAYQLLRYRAVNVRRQLNDILNGRRAIDDLAVLYVHATRHYEAFGAALEARGRAYPAISPC